MDYKYSKLNKIYEQVKQLKHWYRTIKKSNISNAPSNELSLEYVFLSLAERASNMDLSILKQKKLNTPSY